MPEPKVYAFSQHIGTLWVTHDTNVHKLGRSWASIRPSWLRMINGKVVPTTKVIAGLARELNSDRFISKSWRTRSNREPPGR
jgi:hypothetical protein